MDTEATRAYSLPSVTQVDWLSRSTVTTRLPNSLPHASGPPGGNGNCCISSASHGSSSDQSNGGVPRTEVLTQSMFRGPANMDNAIEIDEIFAFLDWDAESASLTSNASPERFGEVRLSPMLPASASSVVNSNGASRITDFDLDRSRARDVCAMPPAITMDDVPARRVYWQTGGGSRLGDTPPQRAKESGMVERPSLQISRVHADQFANNIFETKKRHASALPDELQQKRQRQMHKGLWAGGVQSAIFTENSAVRLSSDGSQTGHISRDRDSDSSSICGLSSAGSSTRGAESLSAAVNVVSSYAEDGVHFGSRLSAGVSRANTEETCSHRSGSVERSVSHERMERRCEHHGWSSEHLSEEPRSGSEGEVQSGESNVTSVGRNPPKFLTRGYPNGDHDSGSIGSNCMTISNQTTGSMCVNLTADSLSHSSSRRRYAAPRHAGITMSRWKR